MTDRAWRGCITNLTVSVDFRDLVRHFNEIRRSMAQPTLVCVNAHNTIALSGNNKAVHLTLLITQPKYYSALSPIRLLLLPLILTPAIRRGNRSLIQGTISNNHALAALATVFILNSRNGGRRQTVRRSCGGSTDGK